MPLTKLDHFLIQTEDVEATANWYEHVLGMHRGPTPDFRFHVVWMYIEDHALVHITDGGKNVSENRKAYLGQQSTDTEGTGVLDHVAFHATGLTDMIARLTDQGISFNQRQVDSQGLYQLFLFDPNGVKVELNYDNSEAAHVDAEVMASDLPAGN
jgi:catechol 2,3-dioxygenase-like lactoylglutathione lyase family enzyme